ncbi:MAG: Serine/threonine protein kinaserelated protein [Planctomycetaceae bacterium]|nr:Serine/threonine protein kinaserelated protein [Planctomycetaceae bacterium]
MPLSLDQFATQLVASKLLAAADLRTLVSSLPPERRPHDGEQLARELIRQKKLTSYQATQIYLGKLQNLTLGNYRILDKLGQGGMGLVLKAEHKLLKRLVAIKVLSPGVTKKPLALQRFQREVEAAAKLSHPNIVAAYDADEDHKTRFLVLEYVEGIDLAEVVQKEGPLPVEVALNYLHQAARGLEYAHQQGVIHRDIKPSNLLLDQAGTVKVLDMGLARLEEDPTPFNAKQAELTDTGIIMGTVDYMSPEQAENTKKADPRSDLYSLGISFFYLLTGRSAYGGETLMERILAHREWPIPSIRTFRPDVSEEVDAVFRKMVAKKPADRYQSMTELIAALAHCMVGEVEHRTTGIRPVAVAEDSGNFVPPPLPADYDANAISANSEVVNFDWSPASGELDVTHRHLNSGSSSRFNLKQLRQPKIMFGGAATLLVIGILTWVWFGGREASSASHAHSKSNVHPVVHKSTGENSSKIHNEVEDTDHAQDRHAAEWVLDQRGTIQIEEDNGQRRDLVRGNEIPKSPFVILQITLISGKIQDEELQHLAGLRKLEALSMPDNRQVTDRSIPVLSQLERLAVLNIPGTGITIPALKSLPQLRSLGLDASQFVGAPIHESHFPELRQLNLIGLRDIELQRLLKLSLPIEHLVLTNAEASRPTWLKIFAHFPDLTELQIVDSALHDDDIANLSKCHRLTQVSLTRTKITDHALKELARVRTLKSLNVRSTQVTRAGIQKFRQALPLCHVEA